MSGVIRWAEAEELKGLVDVERAADGLYVGVGINFSGMPTSIESCEDPGTVLVAGRPPVGFAMLTRIDGLVHLDQLAVHPEHGRQGHGSQLIEAVCAYASEVNSPAVTLTTFRDVSWNAPWYAKRGFAVLEAAAWGPEMAALVAYERGMGIAMAPRVVMRRDLKTPDR
ncbi:GNAT family N-acetyltransferase [Streptosporangiaceae bacterium NEAU-GS5]|nr:GNAT family N-acetyltransferase [Streptosporangiaceae bacterium NEAU-GS5]